MSLCPIICADAQQRAFDSSARLSPDTRSVVVSACWSVPLMPYLHRRDQSDEEHYPKTLTYVIKKLLEAHPSLDQVMVVDRKPDTTDIEPLNCLVRRVSDDQQGRD